jgi:hypothetical protein
LPHPGVQHFASISMLILLIDTLVL